MEHDTPQHAVTVDIDGHQVPAEQADQFFHGSTGDRLTDEQWDEQKTRLGRDNIDMVPPEFR